MTITTERSSFVLASRGSPLARVQTESVQKSLQAVFEGDSNAPTFTSEYIQSGGDKNRIQALFLLGGKGLWTKELELALKEKKVDFLVHSLKDVPTVLPEGMMIAAVLERQDPVDSVLFKASKRDEWKTMDDLPKGSVVGTSSIRRIAQLKRNYPGLLFADCRGNIDTRITKKLDPEDSPYAALILAKAGLIRLDWDHRVSLDLRAPQFFHAVSQGALGVEIRSDDADALKLCAAITHKPSHICCTAERALLRVLEGGCSVPVGVTSKYENGILELAGCVTSLDGSRYVEHTLREEVDTLETADDLGARLAKTLADNGAQAILEEIALDRDRRIADAEVHDAKQAQQQQS
ncbi:porphobilinogen deaminase [Cylindrobasidium torrendii FP15055 ss-10]|uniref:Porphobilinogen deaminase n=1 Tax=Cylindrobasidium torrendii FP15055 ss-10 TaxID=1314674 RepID=A0A0D7B8E7_9AGAR|nr:porphobilinogen deaminase [Cylindrobasidium torrendii FP15055 ss-10]